MAVVSRRVRRRLRPLFFLIAITLFIIYSILPHDSTIRLALVFNASRLFNFLRGAATDRDAWLRTPPRYKVDLTTDVGYLIKTGYGTRHRVPDQLQSFAATGAYLGREGEGFLVVGDWTTVNETDARLIGVTVHDAIKKVMETKIQGKAEDYPRLAKYKSLQEKLQTGNEEEALKIGQTFGWELDALKFIMGMEMIYSELPRKKWYIILDDDTFLIRPSLELLLGHIDFRKPQYIGNAVGDYKARFGHGGSAILISGEAMRRLFEHPGIVQEAYAESMTETWGDRLVATTLQKLGIYIEESYNHHFNGEPPSITRIWGDRFCSPLVSFHGLRKPGEMLHVGQRLAEVDGPLLPADRVDGGPCGQAGRAHAVVGGREERQRLRGTVPAERAAMSGVDIRDGERKVSHEPLAAARGRWRNGEGIWDQLARGEATADGLLIMRKGKGLRRTDKTESRLIDRVPGGPVVEFEFRVRDMFLFWDTSGALCILRAHSVHAPCRRGPPPLASIVTPVEARPLIGTSIAGLATQEPTDLDNRCGEGSWKRGYSCQSGPGDALEGYGGKGQGIQEFGS
ncbi:hypothetical protein ACJZ2D_003612 [Fusarium nematophilum]